jgi:hypothetical protein
VSQSRTALLRLETFGGGLNDTDPPHRIGDDQLASASDVELTSSGGIVRRNGASRVMAPPSTTALVSLLHRHTPSQSLTNTEVWAIPTSATEFYRSLPVDNYNWSAAVSVSDTGSATPPTDAVSFNGKLYVAYEKNAGTDRLHCFDGTTVRRVGISTPVAATVADTGAGAYAATIRYYKVQFMTSFGADGRRAYSDLGASVSFTPSGAGTAARVTKPTTPDGATHWILYGSPDNISYYILASTVVGTTTFDDTVAPSAYAAVNPSITAADAGAFTPPWSAKFLLVDENRLLIAGAFENVLYASRVGWSAITGTASAAYGLTLPQDDERFPPDNFLDLDSDEGGELTGMESLNGAVYVFKRFAIYKLVRTGNADAPYKPVTVSKAVGALSRKSIVVAEDEAGAPCLYFLSERGPYRLGVSGLHYLGADIETTWALVNMQPGRWKTAPHGVYDASNGRVFFWCGLADDAVAYGNVIRLTYHVRHGRMTNGRIRGGWTKTASTSKPMHASASALLPSSLTLRESPLTPHGIHTYNGAYAYPPVVWKYVTGVKGDDDVVNASGTVTGTENYTQSVTTKTFSLGLGHNNGVTDVYALCTPYTSGVTLTATLARDFGVESRSASQTFTGTTARLPQQVHDLTMAQAQYVSLSISAAATATGTRHTLDEIALRVRREEPV